MASEGSSTGVPITGHHPTRIRTVDLPGPDSVIWRYAGLWHLVIISTLRNLVLEVAHPIVGLGVLEHSRYHEDPWKRLNHTFKSYQRYVYGSPHDTLAEARELRRIHGAIHGVDDHGHPYHALDPEAYFWVHATLFESILHWHEFVGAPLDDSEMGQAYDEWRSLGVVLGIREDHMPPDLDSFRRYFDDLVEERLEDNPVVRDLLGPGVTGVPCPIPLVPPVLWRLLWPPLAFAYLRATVTLLPPAFRRRLGLEPSWLESTATQVLARALHLGSGLLPRRLRYLPKASAALLAGSHHRPVSTPGLLARLIDRVPREPLAEDAEAYLAVVEAVLHSSMPRVGAVATLRVVVDELGLDPDEMRALHGDYLAALTKAAVEDGTMTNAERNHLDAVARILEEIEGLPPAATA